MMYCRTPGPPISPHFGNIDLLPLITFHIKAKDEEAIDNLYLWRNWLDTSLSRNGQGFDPTYLLVFFFFSKPKALVFLARPGLDRGY
jgi:hypothetical protein